MEKFISFGDSITVGVGASVPASSWFGLIAPINKASSGSQAAEVSKTVQGLDSVAGGIYTVMVGTNDHRQYKSDGIKQGYFTRFLRQAVAWLALPAKVKARDAGMAYTGTWSNTVVNSFGKFSTAQGATAQCVVHGTAVYIAHILQDSMAADSSATVEIDGIEVGTLETYAPGMATVNGSTYASAAVCFGGLCDGDHVVKITLTTAGKYFYLDWIAGNGQQGATVLLSDVISMSAAGYSQYGTSEAIVLEYNDIIAALTSEMSGMDIRLIPNHASINPLLHLADGVHPNDAGHAVISENMLAQIE